LNWNGLEIPDNPYYSDDAVVIYNADCRDILPQLPKVDLVLTDPPYGKNYTTGYRIGVARDTTRITNDTGDFDLVGFLLELRNVTHWRTHFYMFSCWQNSDKFKVMIENLYLIKNKLIWVKNNWTAGDLDWTYGQSYEEIFYFVSNGSGRRPLNGNRDRDCLFYDRVAGNEQVHLNQKPAELIDYLILKSSEPKNTILDPFLGSGTTAYCAKKLNRKCIGIEIEEKYCEIAAKRCSQTVMNFNC